jgi:hypothetical protein
MLGEAGLHGLRKPPPEGAEPMPASAPDPLACERQDRQWNKDQRAPSSSRTLLAETGSSTRLLRYVPVEQLSVSRVTGVPRVVVAGDPIL